MSPQKVLCYAPHIKIHLKQKSYYLIKAEVVSIYIIPTLFTLSELPLESG